MQKTTLKISGMSCNHCKMRVEKALKELEGVSEAGVDLQAGSADVTFDESRVTSEKLAEAVEDAGYTVEK